MKRSKLKVLLTRVPFHLTLFGHLNKNKFCGEGAFTYPFGTENVSYSGAIKDGKLDGQGKVNFSDGRQFEGQFTG